MAGMAAESAGALAVVGMEVVPFRAQREIWRNSKNQYRFLAAARDDHSNMNYKNG
jgi:hypothetical protein